MMQSDIYSDYCLTLGEVKGKRLDETLQRSADSEIKICGTYYLTPTKGTF